MKCMFSKMFVVTFIVALFIALIRGDDDILCKTSDCTLYIQNENCPSMRAVDDDHKLPILPINPCNCCPDFYLAKLDNGSSCLLGDPSSTLPREVCGDGLYCKANELGEGICVPMTNTKCTQEQANWELRKLKGLVGYMELRPNCDRNGNYAPVQCIPGQTCYCRNENGERIFGTSAVNRSIELNMRCECSRTVDKAVKLMSPKSYSDQIMRCTDDGNFDPIQCINDQCICADEKTGVPSDTDWFKPLVNVSDLTNATMWCFNNQLHKNRTYLKPCQQNYRDVRKYIVEMKKENISVIDMKYPSCQADGNYAAVQENADRKFCAKPNGEMIERFEVKKTSALVETMNCHCARARFILSEAMKQSSIHHFDLPDCENNGNYKSIQCRLNLCRCVDDNGNQVGLEVDKNNVKELICPPE